MKILYKIKKKYNEKEGKVELIAIESIKVNYDENKIKKKMYMQIVRLRIQKKCEFFGHLVKSFYTQSIIEQQ